MTPEEYEMTMRLAEAVAENGCVLITAEKAADLFARALLTPYAAEREKAVWLKAADYMKELGDKSVGKNWEPYYHCAALLRAKSPT